MSSLALLLHGPVQSWGDSSKLGVRETAGAPTFSGVLGLIRAALGDGRDSTSELRERLHSLEVVVRGDRPGQRLRDYHTVTATPPVIRTGAGLEYGATLVSERWYLSDAVFLAVLGSEDGSLLEEVREALQAPRWHLSLGRKSCPASAPLVVGLEGADPIEVVSQYPLVRPQHETVNVWVPGSARRRADQLLGPAVQLEESATMPMSASGRHFMPRTVHRYALAASRFHSVGDPWELCSPDAEVVR